MEYPVLKNIVNDVAIEIKDNPFTIGRALSCNYIISNAKISRVHCSLEKSENKWFLRDSSSNGTYINGVLLPPKNQLLLKNKDIIAFSPEGEKYIFQDLSIVSADNISDEQLNLIADSVQEFSATDTPLTTSDTNVLSIIPHSSRTDVMSVSEKLLHQTSTDNPTSKKPRIDNVTTSQISDKTCSATSSTTNSKDEEKKSGPETNLQENSEEMEDELMCSICSELFIKATTLNCSHTFCKSCIEMWKRTNSICPICRAGITVMTPTLVLDNVIDRMIQSSSSEVKEQRKKIVEERTQEQIQQYSNRGRGRGRGIRGRSNRGRGRGRGGNRGDYDNRYQNIDYINPPIINLDTSESDSEDGDSYISTSYDDSNSDTEEWLDGIPGAYFGGYGRCYNCGRRGHWTNGCPYR